MFKPTNAPVSTSSRPAESNSPDRLNRIVEGTAIQGDIKSDSNIRIDGRVIGNITTAGRLVIGATGHIEGEILCQNADIEGFFNGKITVQEQLSLKATARLTGDIVANKLSIEPGANFTGSCSMAGNRAASSRPAANLAEVKTTEKIAQPVEA
jgi:cytoskeletal protein CcmA (bactofilin family)